MTFNTKGVFTEEEIQRAQASLDDMIADDIYINLGKDQTYIVAGNLGEFRAYVNRKHAEDVDNYGKKYIYVRDRYTLMGLSNITGYYIGTAFMRKDIDQIKQAIAYVKEKANLPHDNN